MPRPSCDIVAFQVRAGARHLRQALHGGFNFFPRHHHQIGHFVNHHNNKG